MGVSYSLQGPDGKFVKGAGGTLCATYEVDGQSNLSSSAIYLYPVGSDAPVDVKIIHTSTSKCSGSMSFPTQSLAVGKKYEFRWHSGKHGLFFNAGLLATSDPFEVSELEQMISKHTSMSPQNRHMANELAEALATIAELQQEVSQLKRKRASTEPHETATSKSKARRQHQT